MSIRENIADNLKTTLSGLEATNTVTREPFDFLKLSNHQYPAVLIRSSDEDRSDATIGGSITSRSGVINYEVVGYVKADAIDTARNNLIEAIEEGLDIDRTRGGYALDTQVTKVEVDDGSIDPIGGVILTVRVLYKFTRGAA